MNKVIPEGFIDMVRTEVDGMIDDVRRREPPATTEELTLIVLDKRHLTDVEHRQILAASLAILLQQVAHS